MNNWRLLYTPPSSGAWNMAVDESILEHIHRGESLPTLRLYSWDPPCLSLGHAQSFADVDVERLQANGWEVVRRVLRLYSRHWRSSIVGNWRECRAGVLLHTGQ